MDFNKKRETPHFIVLYNLRNPLTGRGHGLGGVRDEALIETYIAALEQLYAVMTKPPWSRNPPRVGRDGKTLVRVRDVTEPYAAADDEGIPYICLPCWNGEPTLERAQLRASAEAVHEATHVFNWRERPLTGTNAAPDLNTNPWRWMHEAMAVYMETVVLRANDDFHRYLRYWVALPEISLDNPNAGYHASLFLCYLAEKMGDEVVNRIWTPPVLKETPLSAIERILMEEKGRKFASPLPDDDDVFASGYCMDSYFLQDTDNASHTRNIFKTHGERAVCESFCLSAGDLRTTKDSIDHLACRYYRFFLDSRISKLEVQLIARTGQRGTTLKGELATVTKEMKRGSVFKMRPSGPPASATNSIQLCADVTQIAHDDADHFVMVVSNCGFRSAQPDPSIEHDDRAQYSITIQAR